MSEKMSIAPANQTEPKIIPLSVPVTRKQSAWECYKAFGGLLWCEWYAHSRLLLFFLAAWIVCTWVMPLYAHPAFILFFGVVFAIIAGPAYGGSDTAEGSEEFTFALPPTRSERYLARLTVGGSALLLFTAMDILAL